LKKRDLKNNKCRHVRYGTIREILFVSVDDSRGERDITRKTG
jgi:hypothetical protein